MGKGVDTKINSRCAPSLKLWVQSLSQGKNIIIWIWTHTYCLTNKCIKHSALMPYIKARNETGQNQPGIWYINLVPTIWVQFFARSYITKYNLYAFAAFKINELLLISSSVSSSINSMTAVIWEDILKDHFVHLPETRKTLMTKIIGENLFYYLSFIFLVSFLISLFTLHFDFI